MLEIVMQNYLKDKKLPKKARTSRKIIKSSPNIFQKRQIAEVFYSRENKRITGT